MRKNSDAAKEWFKKAENDLLNIKNNLEAEDVPTDTVCFHAQQAVEKFIKGALVYFGQELKKVHDLDFFLGKISSFIPELKEKEDDLEKLASYAVDVRYPIGIMDMAEPTVEEAREAYKIALEIKEIVTGKIKL